MIKTLLIGVGCGALALTIGILIGHFGIEKESEPEPSWVKDVAQDVDEDMIKQFISEVDNDRIGEHLRQLTKVPHMATSAGDEETVEYVLKNWNDPNTGLDDAWREDYYVYLSFPNPDKPNMVTVVNQSDEVLHTNRLKEVAYFEEQNDPDVVQPFAAYSPAGNAKGKLVFANRGTVSDYQHLNSTLDLRGTIAITRYGGAGRAAKAINAAPFGVVGVLVYTDPLEMNDGFASEDDTYPHSWYIPPSGVERGSYNTHYGDLLTPYLAAKEDTYRIDPDDITGLPPIPTQPIGFEDARTLICSLGGAAAPEGWKGGLGCTYNLGGPGFSDESTFANSDVKMDIYNFAEVRKSANVMGIIRGSVEPDRYAIYGNHRDSWVHGAIDPSSGTSAMLELSRVLGQMVKQGKWRPRRSIVFGSWGAEEHGLIGSAEYTEQYFTRLSERTVAYINVDIATFANVTLRASSMPSLDNVIFEAAKQVSAPGSGSTTVYDQWIKYYNRTSNLHGNIPKLFRLTGAGSDYAAFVHYLGITSIDMSYYYDASKTTARIYPAYHTAYDTYDYAARYIDPGFLAHQAVARTAGNILIRFADSLVLPFSCLDYHESLEEYLDFAKVNYKTQVEAKGISMVPLETAVKNFGEAASNLDQLIKNFDLANETPLSVRKINDQLMLLDRAFLNPLAFPDKYGYRHVIWASRSSGHATFPGLSDAFVQATTSDLDSDWDKVHYHLSVLSQAIDGATSLLVDVI